jgi:hypothetical protein
MKKIKKKIEKKYEIKRKEKNVYIYKEKAKVNKAPDSLDALGVSRGFKIKTILIFPTMCNPITRTLFVPQDHSFPFAHVHLSQKVCVHLSPLLVKLFFQ